MDSLDRYRGCLLGLAVGDALGTTLEFCRPGTFEPLADMVGGGPFGLKPGEWTDDTSMALCLAESLLLRNGFDPTSLLQRFARWWKTGYRSSTDRCFDIGATTSAALADFLAGGRVRRELNPREAGNGSLMRLAPVPLFYAKRPAKALTVAAESSYTTHGAKEAADACAYFAGLIVGALSGLDKAAILAAEYCPVENHFEQFRPEPTIRAVMAGSFKHKKPPEIAGTGHVVKSLEAALWAFHTTECYRDGCLAAANLGDDADTTAAIYGQLAGAFYGEPGIPRSWLSKIAHRELITRLADHLWAAAG